MKYLLFLFSCTLLLSAADFKELYAHGESLREKKQYEGAADCYKNAAAAAVKPEDMAMALFRQGEQLHNLRRLDEAVDVFARAASTAGATKHTQANSLRQAAMCRQEQGRTSAAIEFYKRSCAIHSNFWSETMAYQELAAIYKKLSLWKEAAECLDYLAASPLCQPNTQEKFRQEAAELKAKLQGKP